MPWIFILQSVLSVDGLVLNIPICFEMDSRTYKNFKKCCKDMVSNYYFTYVTQFRVQIRIPYLVIFWWKTYFIFQRKISRYWFDTYIFVDNFGIFRQQKFRFIYVHLGKILWRHCWLWRKVTKSNLLKSDKLDCFGDIW